MKIKTSKITPRQKLIIEKGLCDYKYIMKYWRINDQDFQDVYYDFYLKARWVVMSIRSNKTVYFDELHKISSDTNLITIIDYLRNNMNSFKYEFSISSKLLHTRNTKVPIYDDKVKTYLGMNEKVEFWWHRKKGMYGNPAPRGTSEIAKIEHDWKELCKWYKGFLKTKECNNWIKWFDASFPCYKNISDIKKIDFIIFATN